MDPINWVVPLHDVPHDFNQHSPILSELKVVQIEREESGRYVLRSSKFEGLPTGKIRTVAAELIQKINAALDGGSITMGIPIGIKADGLQVTLVTSDSGAPIEVMRTVVADAHVPIGWEITLAELPRALRERKSAIDVLVPQIFPAMVYASVFFLIARSDGSVRSYVTSVIAGMWGLGFLGLMKDYNLALELKYRKVVVRLRLEKPKQLR